MQFQVITSTADGNQTKEFSNWEDAHFYANEWMDNFTHWNHRHFNNIETTEYVNLWKTRKGETVRIEEIDNDDSDLMCDGCANQESIAAPGETTKCRKHREYKTMEDVVREENESDEIASDEKADQWFIERASEFEFHPFVTTCSMCFERKAFYIGVTSHGTPFEFCRICRDDLVRRADAAKQSPERYGM